ncbi:MAG: DUF2007 domain-containing protein [Bacteroidetes bacterium]|jgi:hypothetical protein|nr:DUF2007 domain-containing protein [Bacteroidota bacterium]MBU1578261.1 DUF2007 domain-containing protein [Bacteroidota bacterium]MBU2465700.1 DUF2007 domain-containing protein [Bacteroidota bacterium]MBU2559096.1 DUF2007 domain-containing protein [Bacteroidota bacterium]MDA3944570.1 DUF2007 domain-containing protein [Bacteroidota bacterium]
MEHDLVEIYSGNEIQAMALKYELERSGIECMIRNDQEAGNLIGIGSIQFAVRVLIDQKNLKQANLILDDFLKRNQA